MSAPSIAQASLLRVVAAAQDKTIIRWPGGYWTTERPGIIVRAKGHWGTPKVHFGTNTVRACEARGWLARAGKYPEEWKDNRVLTEEAMRWV